MAFSFHDGMELSQDDTGRLEMPAACAVMVAMALVSPTLHFFRFVFEMTCYLACSPACEGRDSQLTEPSLSALLFSLSLQV